MSIKSRFLVWIAIFLGTLVFASPASAVIVFRAAAKATLGPFISPGTLTITKPAGTILGDVMIASIAVGTRNASSAGVTITPPAGWTLIRRTNQTSSNASALATYYKVAGAAEAASYSFSIAAGINDGAVGGITSFSGVNIAASPIDVSAGQATVSNTNHTAPAVTTTIANDMLVTVHEYSSSGTWTPPPGMAESVDAASLTPNNAGGISMEMSYQAIAAAGSTGTRTAKASTSKDRGATQSIALLQAPPLHHIRIEHDGIASSCAPEAITLKACMNAACTAPYYAATDVTGIVLSPTTAGYTWSPSSTVSITAASGGINNGSITLARSSNGTATLAITGTSIPAPSNVYECYNTATGTSGDCNLVYSGNFSFDILDNTSATRQVVALTSCTASFANLTRSVKFWSTYLNPASGTKQGVIVAGTGNSNCSTGYAALGTSLAGATTLNLSFGAGAAPQATFSVCYPDVGLMQVDTRYDGSAGTGDAGVVILGNDTFVSKPDHFTVTNVKRTSDNVANPGAANASGAVFISAGDSTTSAAQFTATVTAMNALNVATPNYGLATTPEGIKITSTLVAPVGGDPGTLSCKGSTTGCLAPGGSANFSGGATTITDLAWSDVGIITILPRIGDGNYLGTGDVTTPTSSGNIGRFRASQLTVEPGSGSLQPRADIASPASCVAAAAAGDIGDMLAGSTLLSGVTNVSPFVVGDSILVVGAGASGADLFTTVTAVDAVAGSLTLATAASTAVTNAPVFQRAPFSYMGEPMRLTFQVNALNAAGQVTKNYDSTLGFAKLTGGSATGFGINDSWGLWGAVDQLAGVNGCRALFASTATYNTTYLPAACVTEPASGYSATSARIATSGAPSASWLAGVGTLNALVQVNSASKPDGTFDWLGLGVLPQDADGVLTTSVKDFDTDSTAGVDRVRTGTAQIRYGRARLLNANGSELLDLPMTFRNEYWKSAANGWQLNSSDTCSGATLALTAVGPDITSFTCVRDSGNPGNSGAGCSAAAAAAGKQYKEAGVAGFAGDFNLWLQAPGLGNAGAVLVTATVPSWLQYNWTGTLGNPFARATFGVARSGRVVFRRERY